MVKARLATDFQSKVDTANQTVLARATTQARGIAQFALDFLDGKRRQFQRFYFTSEADLLDLLRLPLLAAAVGLLGAPALHALALHGLC